MDMSRIISECCEAEELYGLDELELHAANLRARADVEGVPLADLCRRLVEYAEDEMRRAREND